MSRTARLLLWLPLVLFLLVLVLVASGLFDRAPQQRIVKSAMVGKPIPAISLPPAVTGKPGIDPAVFRSGKPRLLNIFASWCVPCIAEAPQLLRLRQMGVTIDAVAVRDSEANLRAFLDRNGDPFRAIGADPASQIQLTLGSSGVPETFLIDGNGRIVDQHIGDIRADDIPGILARLERAR